MKKIISVLLILTLLLSTTIAETLCESATQFVGEKILEKIYYMTGNAVVAPTSGNISLADAYVNESRTSVTMPIKINKSECQNEIKTGDKIIVYFSYINTADKIIYAIVNTETNKTIYLNPEYPEFFETKKTIQNLNNYSESIFDDVWTANVTDEIITIVIDGTSQNVTEVKFQIRTEFEQIWKVEIATDNNIYTLNLDRPRNKIVTIYINSNNYCMLQDIITTNDLYVHVRYGTYDRKTFNISKSINDIIDFVNIAIETNIFNSLFNIEDTQENLNYTTMTIRPRAIYPETY